MDKNKKKYGRKSTSIVKTKMVWRDYI